MRLGLREITKGANPRSVDEMAPVLYGIWPAPSANDKYNWTLGLLLHRKGLGFEDTAHLPVCGA
jgi:hypothetical protein